MSRFKIGDRVSPTFSTTWVAGPMTAADPPRFRGALVDGVLAELVACDERHAVLIPSTCVSGGGNCLVLVSRPSMPCLVRALW
nr:hypothetical protein [Paraburkholderia phosphatilytica]